MTDTSVQSSQHYVAVAFDGTDVRRLPAGEQAQRIVLPLTPEARAALEGTGEALLEPKQNFSECAQARAVSEIRTNREQFFERFAELSISRPMTREMVSEIFDRVSYSAVRVWFTLGRSGPWLVPKQNDWLLTDDRVEAAQYVMRRILDPVAAGMGRQGIAPLPFPRVYRGLRSLVLRHLANRERIVVAGAMRSAFGLLPHLARGSGGVSLVVAQPCGDGIKEYGRLLASFFKCLKKSSPVFIGLCADTKTDFDRAEANDALVALIEAISNPIIRSSFQFCSKELLEGLRHVPSIARDAQKTIKALQPEACVNVENSVFSNWLLAETCGEFGISRIVVGRNGHSPAHGAVAKESAHRYFLDRFPPSMTDLCLLRSPTAVACAEQAFQNRARPEIRRFSVMPSTVQARVERQGQRRILLADSFAGWYFRQPWIYQSSDEFVEGARLLVDAVRQVPNARLTVRMKAKAECGQSALYTLLGEPADVEVQIRDIPIQEELNRTDLLVSFRSTVIDEAVEAGVPVLLWGATNRYRYLPARTKLPVKGDRAPVYSVDRCEDIAPMIEAILAAHAGDTVSASEQAGLRWPAPEPSPFEATMTAILEAADVSKPARLGRMPITRTPSIEI